MNTYTIRNKSKKAEQKMSKRKYVNVCVLFFMSFLLCIGCGKTQTEDKITENIQEEQEEATEYVIIENDVLEETFILYSLESNMEHYYTYSFSTRFQDKYGNYASASEFTQGRVVTIGNTDREGRLSQVQLTDEVWEYENVHRFSIDMQNGIFTIADTKYSIRDEVLVFSNGEKITFADITKDDVLKVVGKDKKIISVVVTTGHGTLALKNTTLFEDSFLQLNTDMFFMITEDMELEVPEGIYMLTVANNGWGSTTEIQVVRGETTEVDLDTLKGEGPKRGLISFQIDVEDVEVYIDYELVDHTEPVSVTYGTHKLKVAASGYDTWERYLSVNSQEATLIIELTEGEEETETESESEDEGETESESEDESETETESESDEA